MADQHRFRSVSAGQWDFYLSVGNSISLMEQALLYRLAYGVEAAADWLEGKGFPRELVLYALIGSQKAEKYGARPVSICKQRYRDI